MTPEHKIRHLILIAAREYDEDAEPLPATLTAEQIDELWDEDSDAINEAKYEFRSSGIPTPELPTPSTRHFEVDAVAAQYIDGTWVGWLYWHGGGKHAEPEAIDWMEDAYDLKVIETKTITVNVFAKAN